VGALLIGPLVWLFAPVPASATVTGAIADVHPPIGVLGDVSHSQGSVMFSYRYHRQDLSGLMIGTADVTTPIPGFTVVPSSMNVNTNLFEVMWAPLDEFTIVLTLPYFSKSMTQTEAATGLVYETSADGFGDFAITLLYQVFQSERSRVHLNIGISLPTGSITESQLTPVNNTLERLPYMMQLGSGTVDLRPGATYNGEWKGTYWGGQITGVLHAGTNSQNYRLGDEYDVTAWAGRRWTSWFGTAFRLDWQHWFDPDGADPLMDPNESPADNPTMQGGRRLDALFGVDFFFEGELLKGTRLSVEAGLPAYQDLSGPQLGTTWLLTAGLQYVF
jgi:hypothetical protein